MRVRMVVVGTAGLVAVGAFGLVVARHVLRTSPQLARRLDQPIPVMVARATRQDLTEQTGAVAESICSSVVLLTTRVSARISDVAVEAGDAVGSGQPLVRLQTDQLEAAVARAQAELEQSVGDLTRAEQRLGRLRRVFEQEMVTVTEIEQAEAALAAARADQEEARERLIQAQSDLSQAVVKSPVAGLVIERRANPGETPKVGGQLLEIGRIDPILVGARVSEEDIGKLSLGQPADVTFPAFPGLTLRGSLLRLDPAADTKTQTLRAIVQLANPDLRLRPGLTAFVRFERSFLSTLVIPSVALIGPTGPSAVGVFVVAPSGEARFRKVRVGASASGLTQILDGLKDGEQVVTVGQSNLHDGSHVRIGDDFSKQQVGPGEGRP